MKRVWGATITGIAGTAILLALGLWQVQRLDWKRGELAEIEARIVGVPVALPSAPEEGRDRFLPVDLIGSFGPEIVRVVTTTAGSAGFRLLSPFETGGRRILVDRGVVPSGGEVPPPPSGPAQVLGNLHWPDESDRFTPSPDIAARLWYARDIEAIADLLGTEPVLVVARRVEGDRATPRPTDTAAIPNDHLEYAITWFSLAAVWAGMTGILVWRMTRPSG